LWPLLATAQAQPAAKAGSTDYEFIVVASQVWIDTGLDLDPGDRISVRGGILACENRTPSEKAHLPLPSAPGGSLLLKLHAEANPILASPDADIPIVDPSHVYLGVNGWRCHGKIGAKVRVKRAGEARTKKP
jgi:hypothetical protein